MAHVFISYSSKDKDYATLLADDLQDRGFNIWIDKAELRSSDNWWEHIVGALRDASAVVVLMSPNSRESRWVQREVALADHEGIPMFPLLLAGENFEIFILTQFDDVREGSLPGDAWYESLAEKVSSVTGERGKDITQELQAVSKDSSDTANISVDLSENSLDWASISSSMNTNVRSLAEMIEERIDGELRSREGTGNTMEEVRHSRQMKERLRKRGNIISNIGTYLTINSLLIVMWYMAGGGLFWPAVTLSFWGLAIIGQAYNYYQEYGLGKEQEQETRASALEKEMLDLMSSVEDSSNTNDNGDETSQLASVNGDNEQNG